MTRYHLTYDFSNGPDAEPVQTPYTADEEAAADIAAHQAQLVDLRPDQFWAMIAIAGLQSTVDATLAAISDPTQKAIATAKIDHSPVFQRDNAFVVSLSAAAGLTTDQVDALWIQAAAIP